MSTPLEEIVPAYREITKREIKPLFSIHKRRPKAERRKTQPLFWVEPHVTRDMSYVGVYVPCRIIVIGYAINRPVVAYKA